jgi:hypothetical protein
VADQVRVVSAAVRVLPRPRPVNSIHVFHGPCELRGAGVVVEPVGVAAQGGDLDAGSGGAVAPDQVRPYPVLVWTPELTGRFLDAAADDPHYSLWYLLTFRGLRRGGRGAVLGHRRGPGGP